MRRIILISLLLAGCASPPTSQAVSDQVVPRYLGKPMDLVFARWGRPDWTSIHDDGTIYRWNRQGCRIDAHAGDALTADRPQMLIGVRFKGDEQGCANRLQLLN